MGIQNRERCEKRSDHLLWTRTQGFALIAALLLVVMVGMAGVIVLQTISTEVKISGNYKTAIQSLYWAEAGIAEARRRLRGVPASGHPVIGDPQSESDPQWSAYILTSKDWTVLADRSYRSQYTNYIPTSLSQTNTRVVVNSLQTALQFWSKIRHKTEFDAEQAGHRQKTPHYVDADGSLKQHRADNVGRVIHYGYPTLNATRPVQLTSSAFPMGFPVELITASSGNNGTGPVIEVEVVRPPGPKILAALYSKGPVSLLGASTMISGLDSCGVAHGVPPIYTNMSVSFGKGITVNGAPPIPKHGLLDIDLAQAVKDLKDGAMTVTSGAAGRNFGSSSHYVTVLANAGKGEIIFRDVRGFGILLIEGNLILEGRVEWNGLVVSTGHMTLKGTGSGIHVQGAIWAKQIEDRTGQFDMAYNSCQIKAALFAKPLQIRSWREIF